MSAVAIDVAAVNAMDRARFVTSFGALYEHAPWVADVASTARPFADLSALAAAFERAMRSASPARRLALVRAHPPLGARALAQALTVASTREQASAGLDRLAPGDGAELARLNAAYEERFGFPFVICVREHTLASILGAARRRLGGTQAAELETALDEIAKIGRLRLHDLLRELRA